MTAFTPPLGPRHESDEPPRVETMAAVEQRVAQLIAGSRRALLGIAGPPGAGKSTLAEAIVKHVGSAARVVSMDGFHLARAELSRLGRLERMGAIDTFDAAGFLALIARLRADQDETVYAPEFRRDIEESIACAVAIEPSTSLVVIDGNYLLISDAPWRGLADLLDEIWYCERDEQDRIDGLVTRHRSFGKTREAAEQWVSGTDQANAKLISSTRDRADLVVHLAKQR